MNASDAETIKDGSYFFLNLNAGMQIQRKKFKRLPITQAVIDRVHAIAIKEKQQEIIDDCPIFEWRPNRHIQEDDEGDSGNEQDDDTSKPNSV